MNMLEGYKWMIIAVILFAVGVIGAVLSVITLNIGVVYIWAVFLIATIIALLKSYAEFFIPKREATI